MSSSAILKTSLSVMVWFPHYTRDMLMIPWSLQLIFSQPLHPSLSFTMELPIDNKISFIGIEIIKNRTKIDTQVYRKPTNTGLLLHFHSHTDKRYKDCLLKTMIRRAYALSWTTEAFNQGFTRLRSIFNRPDYPLAMINSTITKTIHSFSFGTREKNEVDSRVSLPYKD